MSRVESESGFQSYLTLTKSVSNPANGKFGLNRFIQFNKKKLAGLLMETQVLQTSGFSCFGYQV